MDSQSRTLVCLGPLRDVSEFREFASLVSRLQPYGEVLVNVAAVADKAWFEVPEGGSPWHEYAAYNPVLFKFFPHPKIAPHLPGEWVETNRELLLEKAGILRELGLGVAFWGYEIAFLPESFFAEHPHLRGPRMDHPRRSRKEAFSFCPDLAETREMIEWMMAELTRNVPELSAYIWRTNDAGGGLCWAAAQYSGPNGPRHCAHISAGERVRDLVETLQRGAREGGGEITVHIDGSNFWQQESELVAQMLPERTFFYQMDRSVAHLSTGQGVFYPIRGLFDPLEVIAQAERLLDPKVRVVVMDFRSWYERDSESLEAVAKVIEIAEATLGAKPHGTRARLDVLHELCTRWAGADRADDLVDAFVTWRDAVRKQRAVAGEFQTHHYACSVRLVTRPLLIEPEALTPEEESYFLPHIFNPHLAEARSDYIDMHGSRIDLGHGEHLCLPAVQQAIADARQAAETMESMEGVPERDWLLQFACALRVWASIIRSCHNFYFGQVIRDRNRAALEAEPRVPPKKESWTGDADILAWNELMRDELDNTNELIALLEERGMDAVSVAPDAAHEDPFYLGPNLVEQLRTKARLMREHWLDVEKWLAPPHK